MAVLWSWTGAPTESSVRIKAGVTSSTARIALSTTDDFTTPTYYGPYTASNGIVDATISGLPAGQQYYYAVESAGDRGYLSLNGTDAYAWTPTTAGMAVTDLDLRAEVQLDAWPPSGEYRVMAKFATALSNGCTFQFTIRSTKDMRLIWSPTGSSTSAPGIASTALIPDYYLGRRFGVRVTMDVNNGAGGYTAKFWTSDNFVDWTQLGADIVGAATTSFFNSPTNLCVGARDNPFGNPFKGRVYRAQMRNGIDGTIVANPDFRVEGTDGWATGNTSATSARNDSVASPWKIAGGGVIAASQTGGLDTGWLGKFRTLAGAAGTPVSHKVASWACAGSLPRFRGALGYTSNHPVLDTITSMHDPDMLVQLGDLNYSKIQTADTAAFRRAYDGTLSRNVSTRMSRHLAQTPGVYMWDNCDFGGAIDPISGLYTSNSTFVGKDNAAAAYREYVPYSTDVAASGAIYHSKRVGRVLHVFTDGRYFRSPDSQIDNDSKTLLGATQLAWLETLLSTTTAEFLVFYTSSQWLGTSEDSWGNFATERDKVVRIFQTPGGDARKNWTGRMVAVMGDLHALAMDDGSGNPYGGFPCYVMASVDSTPSPMQIQTYKMNGEFVPSSPGRARYGVLDITDDGSSINIDAACYVGRWRKFHHNWTLDLDGVDDTSAVFRASDVEAYAEIDWSAGTYFGDIDPVPAGFQAQPITDWKITRELATDVPDEVRLTTGLSAAEATTNVAAPSGVSLGHWSPWRTTLPYLKAPVKLSVLADGTRYQQFVGSTDTSGSDPRGVSLAVSALDDMVDLAVPANLPSFAGEMAGDSNPGITTEWVVEHALQQAGSGVLWDPGPNCLYYQSLAGSTMTSVGGWRSSTSPQAVEFGPDVAYASDLPYKPCTYHGTRFQFDSTIESDNGFTFGGISGTSPGPIRSDDTTNLTGGSVYVFDLYLDGPSPFSDCFLSVQHWMDADSAHIDVQWQPVTAGTTYSLSFADVELGPWWLTCLPTATGWKMTLFQPGTEPRILNMVASSPFGLSVGLAAPDNGGLNSAMLGAQVLLGGDYTEAELPVYDPDSRAKISPPTMTLTGVPPLDNPTALDVMKDLASAEQGAFWVDEDGAFVFQNRDELRGKGKTPIPVLSEVSLIDAGSWTTTSDQLRSRVEVPVAQPSCTVFVPWTDVWTAGSVIEVLAHQTLDLIIDLDKPVGGITPWLGSNRLSGSRFVGSRSPTGSGTPLANISKNMGRVQMITATRVRVIWKNPYGYPVFFAKSDGSPSLVIAAGWIMDSGVDVIAARDTGSPGTVLTLPSNPWRQTVQDGTELAQWTADEVSSPRPYLTDVQVAFDPRIRLGSIIDLQDPDRYGVSLKCLVRSVDMEGSAGSLSMKLGLQPLRLTADKVDDRWHGMTLADLDAFWYGRTLADFDANPMEELT